MENASKALMIAGGVLLAILTLSLVVYMMTAITGMAEAQDAKNLSEQIAAFNREYDSYNKRRMYGTDVITVINKAINHNKSIEAQVDDPYYINITITTTEDFKTTGQVVTESSRTDMTEDDFIYVGWDIVTDLSRGTYHLIKWQDEETLDMYKDIVNFFSQDKKDQVIKKSNKDYYIYTPLTNFKRAIFQCEEVTYNEDTGRIEEMVFEQIRSATY